MQSFKFKMIKYYLKNQRNFLEKIVYKIPKLIFGGHVQYYLINEAIDIIYVTV